MRNILIVDDDEVQRERVRKTSRKAGFGEGEIFEAANVSDAMSKLFEREYHVAAVDLVLRDSAVEDAEGLNIIQHIRRVHPTCRILGYTAKRADLGPEVYDEGADDFLCLQWAYINGLELLRNRLSDWRKAKPRAFAAAYSDVTRVDRG